MMLVSACLAGANCKYDGKNNLRPEIAKIVKKGEALPICPEQLGGLPTPRSPAALVGGDGFAFWEGAAKVENKLGEDVSAEFRKGAEEVLALAKKLRTEVIIFKERSPSCGVNFHLEKGKRGAVRGPGVCSALLIKNGFRVVSDEAALL